MSINYSIAMLGNPIDEDAPKKAYAKSQYTNILTLDKFAGHIASHGSKYNRADIYAVLMQTVDCMREMLLEGKRIEMGDLGVFSCNLQIFLCLFLEKLNMPQNTPVTKAS